MAKIITVYTARPHALVNMSYVRWYKISEAMARLGHHVDIATEDSPRWKWWQKKTSQPMGENLRKVPLSGVKWSDYDVVKTLYCEGFRTLEKYGGINHPFIISRLGSVVGARDMEGIYFHGRQRELMFSTQQRMNQNSKYIVFLNTAGQELWTSTFGRRNNMLIVPGATDDSIPPPSQDPYPKDQRLKCIFAGNLYRKSFAPEANAALVCKLNRLGEILSKRNFRLYVIGPGDSAQLDREYVSYLGVFPHEETWDYLRFAHVGVELLKGELFIHNNESSKIYQYLRAGLPIVCENGMPNSHLIHEAKLGFVVDVGNLESLADKILEASVKNWNREFAIDYILKNHTWNNRAAIYDKVFKEYSS